MTTMQIDRAVVQQVLEALLNFPEDISDEMFASLTALKAALAQEQAEPTGKQPLQAEPVETVAENATTQQRVVEAHPSDYRRGYWDGFNIGKREGQQDEPCPNCASLEAQNTELDRKLAELEGRPCRR